LVNAGHAIVTNANGKVRGIRLVATASTHGQMTGPPSGRWGDVRFSVRERLDSGAVVWKFHPRSTYPERE
jgi:hypothetical protein